MTNPIFKHFELENHIKIPDYIKNLLVYTGFDHEFTLSKMEFEDISEIERIGREIIPLLENRLFKYLGFFQDSPENFCIFPGHKKIIQELMVFCRNRSQKSSLYCK